MSPFVAVMSFNAEINIKPACEAVAGIRRFTSASCPLAIAEEKACNAPASVSEARTFFLKKASSPQPTGVDQKSTVQRLPSTTQMSSSMAARVASFDNKSVCRTEPGPSVRVVEVGKVQQLAKKGIFQGKPEAEIAKPVPAVFEAGKVKHLSKQVVLQGKPEAELAKSVPVVFEAGKVQQLVKLVVLQGQPEAELVKAVPFVVEAGKVRQLAKQVLPLEVPASPSSQRPTPVAPQQEFSAPLSLPSATGTMDTAAVCLRAADCSEHATPKASLPTVATEHAPSNVSAGVSVIPACRAETSSMNSSSNLLQSSDKFPLKCTSSSLEETLQQRRAAIESGKSFSLELRACDANVEAELAKRFSKKTRIQGYLHTCGQDPIGPPRHPYVPSGICVA